MKQEFIRYVGKEMNSSVVMKISSRLGINEMIPGNASVMVYSQLLDRPAINRMPEYLRETEILRYLGFESIDTADLYESLQEINDMDFSSMEEKLASIFLGIEKERRSVIIDVTDIYFTGDSLDSRPRKGKEGRIKKLMQIALVVTEKRGFPLFHRVYPGNVSNRFTMGDIVKDLWLKGYTVVIMDRGLSGPGRIKSMLEMKFTMICGLKKTQDLKRIIDGIDRNDI